MAGMELAFADARAFDAWLRKNHASSSGLWLKLAKKGAGVPSVSYAEAVEVALSWGWIDGQKKGHDDRFWLQRFCPRGKKSLWSKINREKAQALIAAGKMQPPGLAEVERAKSDGRWDAAYDSPSGSTLPDDFARALAKNARAATFFAGIDAANRYAMLWRVQTAKKAETRARHIETFVAMLARGELLHPERAKKKTAPKKFAKKQAAKKQAAKKQAAKKKR
jgi:uncharacterized protein YdeI (YjbR/CyaY-like superfamily)